MTKIWLNQPKSYTDSGTTVLEFDTDFQEISGIYIFLCTIEGNQCPIYIGQSENIARRIEEHRKEDIIWEHIKKADKFWITDIINENKRKIIEKNYIKKYNPPLNIEFRTEKCNPLFKNIGIPDLGAPLTEEEKKVMHEILKKLNPPLSQLNA